MQKNPEYSLNKCRCGASARIRRKNSHVWIECRNKKCSIGTRFYADMDIPFDTSAEERAINEWNSMNGGTDGGNVL